MKLRLNASLTVHLLFYSSLALSFNCGSCLPRLGDSNDAVVRDYSPAATMGIFSGGEGQVVTVGTINWTLGLSQRDQWVLSIKFTKNVFDQRG